MGTVKLNEPGRQKRGRYRSPVKQAQHAKLYPDLLQTLEEEGIFDSILGYECRAGAERVHAV